jgi:hypothetical protein
MALLPGHFESMFGDMSILIASIETEDGRDIAVQSPSRGSRHYLQDRGAKLGKADCEILFVDEPGKATYKDRFDKFRALVGQGEPQIFSHPLIGTYRARAEGGRHSANSDSRQIRFQCAFLPEDEPQPTTPTGAGVAPIAGVETVSVAAAAAEDALAAAGLESSAPIAALEFFTDLIDSADADSQAAILRVATLTSQINTAISDLELATSVDRWPAYQAMIGLVSAVQLAGETLTADVERMISFRFDRPLPLMALCAEIYGADQAVDNAERVTRINRVRTPNRVPAGTTLRMPAPRSA